MAEAASETRRLFISGIASNLTQQELAKRLQTYGHLTDDLVLNKKNEGTTGIFAHCGLQLDAAAWSRLRKLSGTVLKGSKLRIEEAKQHWEARKALDERRPQPKVPNSRKRPAPGTSPAIESRRVKRGEIVKDGSITQKSRKQGWIKGRYGRAIAILKTEDGVKIPRNPDALSRLWGSAHPHPDQLPYEYDDEEEEWRDRRGRVIRDVEVAKKKQATEVRQGGRVEVWDDMDDLEHIAENVDATIDYVPAAQSDEEVPQLNEEEIDAQLQSERSAGLDLLRDMFKDTEQAEVAKVERQEKRKAKDKLDIVERFDPNAPDEESETDDEHMTATEDSPETKLAVAAKVDSPVEEEQQTASDEEELEEEEDEPLPSFLRAPQGTVKREDLTSIFKLRQQDEDVSFRLAAEEEDSDLESVGQDAVMQDVTETDNIHPDRLHRPTAEQEQFAEGEENANYTALAKDRGFNLSGVTMKKNAAPAFFLEGPGSHWTTQRGLFNSVLDHDLIKSRLEESRVEATRDWKRKEREGNKQMRKATNRHG